MNARFDPVSELILSAFYFACDPRGNVERLRDAAMEWLAAFPAEREGEVFHLADQAKEAVSAPRQEQDEAARLVGIALDRALPVQRARAKEGGAPVPREIQRNRWDERADLQ